MTKTLVFYRGLAGIGKSTKVHAEKLPSVERDHFRREGYKDEGQITIEQRDLIDAYFENGANRVVVSDTNLNPKFFNQFVKWAEDRGYTVEVEDMRGSTPSEALGLLYRAIKQDVGREHAVGEKVIRNQFFNYIAPLFHYKHDVSAWRRDIIVDMDGTMADIRHRSPYDAGEAILKDKPNQLLINILTSLQAGYRARVLFFSGRKESAREYTEQWLYEHLPAKGLMHFNESWELHMRADDDNRPDYVVKEEMFNKVVRSEGNEVVAVFDDRVMMRDYWNILGLNLFSLERGMIF